MNPAGPGPIVRENLSFPIELQTELLRLGFAATEVFDLKSSFDDFRRRNPNITVLQILIREFGNQLSIFPPSNVSRINQAVLLKFLGNSTEDIRYSLARDAPPPPRPNFTSLQTLEQRQQYYQNIVDNITRKVAANSPQENATTSLINAATSLNNAATIGDATSLNDAANSLAVAANLMNNQQHHSIVFVYDIDELVMISFGFITEYMIQIPEINMGLLASLMLGIIDFTNFRGRELRDIFLANIGDLAQNGPVSDKYNSLKQLYNEISNGIQEGGPIISHELIDKSGMTPKRDDLLQAAEQFQQKYSNRWQNAKKCLELVNQKSRESDKKYANVVICKDRIGYGAIQLMVSGLCSEIAIENIYSMEGRSRESILDKMQRRFGEKCVLVYATAVQSLPYVPLRVQNFAWPIEGTSSFEGLYNAQQEALLR